MEDVNYKKWKSLQSHWDDDDFLKTLTPLMKLRYRRLDEKVAEIFEDSFKKLSGKPFLLDFGCGRAEFAAFLSEKWKGNSNNQRDVWNYLGIEPSAEQLKQRDIPQMGMGFLQATAEQIPLQDMVAHGVLMKEAIDHCYDPAKVFSEAKRLLKSGGNFVVTVTNDKSYFKRLFPFVNNARKAHQNDHLNFFGPNELKALASGAKFDRVSVETYNYLKLPKVLERVLGLLGPGVCRGLLNITDAIGKILLPGMGGGVVLVAKKK